MTTISAGGRAAVAGLSITALWLLAACSATPSPATMDPTPLPTTSTSPTGSATPPPVPPPVPQTSSAPPATYKAPTTPAKGSCGTVTAASGMTLQVLDGQAHGVACAEAERVVTLFHRKIAGRQSGDSQEPVGDTVDGWACVSGPPAAQGGTTCSKGDRYILAAVVPNE